MFALGLQPASHGAAVRQPCRPFASDPDLVPDVGFDEAEEVTEQRVPARCGLRGRAGRIETIRRHVTVKAGAAASLAEAASVSLPRIAFVAAPAPAPTLSGRTLRADETDIMIRMIGRGRPHRAVPLTTALCLAVACRLPGTIPNRLLSERARTGGDIMVGHPSGTWSIAAAVSESAQGVYADMASVQMTARRLFQGAVLVPR